MPLQTWRPLATAILHDRCCWDTLEAVHISAKGASLIDSSNALAIVDKCKTLRELRNMIDNAKGSIVVGKEVELSQQVHDKAVARYWEMSASRNEAENAVERALWTALAAYEYLKSEDRGRSVRATYLRRQIKKSDIVTAVSSSVLKGSKTSGLQSLQRMNRLDASFEAVVVNYASAFDPAVVQAAKRTLAAFS
jgi:hypothetical protein